MLNFLLNCKINKLKRYNNFPSELIHFIIFIACFLIICFIIKFRKNQVNKFYFFYIFLQVLWADACMIVYNITQRSSFEYAAKCLAEFKALQNAPTAYLVGNKADLDHLREVSFSTTDNKAFFSRKHLKIGIFQK